jgi:hypothetical protein
MDLRATARTPWKQQTCSFFWSRIRYFSSQICEHLNLVENEEELILEPMEDLAILAASELDLASMPSFSKIQNFMFGGNSYQGLKDNMRNLAQNPRDYIGEMVDIITKNIHPPIPNCATAWKSKGYEHTLHDNLDRFLLALANDADLDNLSASDRIGIKSLQSDVNEVRTRLGAFWMRKLPVWHFYPPIVKSDKFAPCVMALDASSEYEIFEAFTTSSSAFLNLARSLTSQDQKTSRALQSVKSFRPFNLFTYSPSGTAKISYQCVSSRCTQNAFLANLSNIGLW